MKFLIVTNNNLIDSKQAPKSIEIELLVQGNLQNVQLLVET